MPKHLSASYACARSPPPPPPLRLSLFDCDTFKLLLISFCFSSWHGQNFRIPFLLNVEITQSHLAYNSSSFIGIDKRFLIDVCVIL